MNQVMHHSRKDDGGMSVGLCVLLGVNILITMFFGACLMLYRVRVKSTKDEQVLNPDEPERATSVFISLSRTRGLSVSRCLALAGLLISLITFTVLVVIAYI